MPVPQLSTDDAPGVLKSFDSADVWRCYVKNFADREEFEGRYDPWKKIKQAVGNSQFWDRPPGSLALAFRLDKNWTSKQMGRGREYVVERKMLVHVPQPRW